MSLNSIGPDSPPSHGERSHGSDVGSYLAGIVTPLALLAFPALMAYLAFGLTPGNEPTWAKIQLFGGLIKTTISADLQMLYFVMLLAGLGGFAAAVNHREVVRRLFWSG